MQTAVIQTCTGKQGIKGCRGDGVPSVQGLSTLKPNLVYVASTGVIGEQFPMEKVRNGIADAALKLSKKVDEMQQRQ